MLSEIKMLGRVLGNKFILSYLCVSDIVKLIEKLSANKALIEDSPRRFPK